VLGPEGLKTVPANVEAMIVTGGPDDYRIHETPGFAKLLDQPVPRAKKQ
jgi:hypothetical protein